MFFFKPVVKLFCNLFSIGVELLLYEGFNVHDADLFLVINGKEKTFEFLEQ